MANHDDISSLSFRFFSNQNWNPPPTNTNSVSRNRNNTTEQSVGNSSNVRAQGTFSHYVGVNSETQPEHIYRDIPDLFGTQQAFGRCLICGHTPDATNSNARCPCDKSATGRERGGGDADRRSNESSSSSDGFEACRGKRGKGDAGGSKDKESSGGKGAGDGGKGAGDAGKGDGDGDGGGGGGGDDGGGMNGDDERICPNSVTFGIFVGLGIVVLLSFWGAFVCQGTESFWECVNIIRGPSCPLNENMMSVLDKTGGGRGKGSPELQALVNAEYKKFRKAMKNSDCHRLDGRQNCEGLVNYAEVMTGGTIVNTGNTKVFQNPMMCKCKDAKLMNALCIPKEGPCKTCVCETIEGVDNKELHSFGKFQYTESDGPTQIFEVQNKTLKKFPHVKFNFTSNHGNPNYTTVYKIELHGLLDHAR